MILTDENIEVYQKGIEEGKRHSQPSPATLEQLKKMSDDINNLKIDTAVIKAEIIGSAKKQDEILATLNKHIEEESDRYQQIMDAKADRWVQNFVVGFISILCTAFVLGLISLIWIK